MKGKRGINWIRICKDLLIFCWICGVTYSVEYDLMLPYMISVVIIFQASDIEY